MSRTSPLPVYPLSRRDLLRWASVGLAGSALVRVPSAAAASTPGKIPSPPPPLEPLHRFGRMIHEFIVDQVRAAEQAADRRRAALQTKADAEAYVHEVREKIQ